LMTKPLKLDAFCYFRSKLGMIVAQKIVGAWNKSLIKKNKSLSAFFALWFLTV
jgi:hypothetical protein